MYKSGAVGVEPQTNNVPYLGRGPRSRHKRRQKRELDQAGPGPEAEAVPVRSSRTKADWP